MSKCPVCRSFLITIVLSADPRAYCSTCGARWIQVGSDQRAVEPAGAETASLARPAEA